VIDFVSQLFPIEGDRFRVELTEPIAQIAGTLVGTLRLVMFDEDGALRDLKEQSVQLLPERHQNERGRAFLEHTVANVRGLLADHVEFLMPHDLFRTDLLAAPISSDAFARVLADPRALAILERRPDDPRLLATLDPQTRSVRFLRNAELEAAILERIDDPGAFSVYGDALAQNSDPRGELIALQIAGIDATALIEEHAWELLGGLAWIDDVRVDWRFGFPKTITIGVEGFRGEAAHVAWLIRVIAKHPNMAFVETIDVQPSYGWHDDVFEAVGAGLPTATRQLALQTPEHEHMRDIEDAYPGMQSLAELRLESRSFELGIMDLPNLRALDLVTRGLTKQNLRDLRESAWPRLERLVVWIGDSGIHDCDVELADLGWILDGEGLPAVKHLGLCGRADTRGLADCLLAAPILERLDVLDLPQSCLSAEELASLRAKFPKLAIVDDDRFIPCYE
jgi:uncharacterized protein (TIGR02996 family)